eukprot:gene13536-biopygen70
MEGKNLTFKSVMEKQGLAVNCLWSFVVLLLMVTSAPVAQFKGKGISAEGSGSLGEHGASTLTCITAWGLKYDCSDVTYTFRTSAAGCALPENMMKASSAFYIISVIVSLAVFCINMLAIFEYVSKGMVLALCGTNAVLTLIPWVCMTVMWYTDACGGSKVAYDSYLGQPKGIPYGEQLRDGFNMSAGYILTIAAWCIQVIAVICLLAL